MFRKCFVFLFFFLIISGLKADDSVFVSLRGYLGKEELDKARKVLAAEPNQVNQSIILEINSTSGDIVEVLDFAKFLYELKTVHQNRFIVYIEDSAIGPSAILPFLADELYISWLVSWGDIPLGNEKTVPTNLLRNRVLSLIDNQSSKAAKLKVLALAMTDPDLKIVDEGSWKIVAGDQAVYSPVVSEKGETLVVNQHQLKELNLISESLSIADFKKRFSIPEAEKEQSVKKTLSLQISKEQLLESLKKHIKYKDSGLNEVGHLLIDDRESGINQATWIYVKGALDKYKESKPIFIILELNTPGGEVYAAQKISDALKEMDTKYEIPVVCFINNWAISAGAMLAYSCRYIAITKGASMGAAEPVIASELGEMVSASEKVNSAIRTDFANRAAFFDRNPYLAEAMVDKEMIVVLRNGRIIKLNKEDQIRTTGLNPDVVISNKGKLLTLTSDELIKFGVADILVPSVPLTAVNAKEKEVGQWPASKEQLFHVPFFDQIPHATIDSFKMDWRTRFFAFLAHPMVSSLLFMGMMIGFYMELNSPGISLPGSIAAICLFLIILSSFAQEIGNMLELILLFVGLAIILVELLVLPTFGLLGFAGLLFFIAGLFGLMLPGFDKMSFEWDTNSWNPAGEVFFERLAWLCGAVLLSGIIIWILARYVLPSFKTFQRFVLSGNEQVGYVAGDNPSDLPKPGTEGQVIATLRPAGKVMLNDTIYDAMSEGNFIDRGEKVFVTRLEGSVIIVNKVEK